MKSAVLGSSTPTVVLGPTVTGAVSYTHLDVYKRQSIAKGNLIHTFSIVSEVTIENIALVYAPTHIKPA